MRIRDIPAASVPVAIIALAVLAVLTFGGVNMVHGDLDTMRADLVDLVAQRDNATAAQAQARLDLEVAKQQYDSTRAVAQSDWDALRQLSVRQGDIDVAQARVDNTTAKVIMLSELVTELNATINQEIERIQNATAPPAPVAVPANITNTTAPAPPPDIWQESKKVIYVEIAPSCTGWACPTYADLWYLDNSHQPTAGRWNGTDRQPTPYDKWWRYYEAGSDWVVIVDPAADRPDRNVITVQQAIHYPAGTWAMDRNYTTFTGGVFVDQYTPVCGDVLCADIDAKRQGWISDLWGNKTDYMRNYTGAGPVGYQVFNGRLVLDCNHAQVSADRWQDMLADTVRYLRTGCAGNGTAYDLVPYQATTSTKFWPAESLEYQRAQAWARAAADCRVKC